MQRSEEFFVCKWTRHESSGAALLLVAGKLGVVQVLDTSSQTLHWVSLPVHASLRLRSLLTASNKPCASCL